MYKFPDLPLVKRACDEIFENEINCLSDPNNAYKDVYLNDTEIHNLAAMINNLPESYQEALLARRCFGFSNEETSRIFGLDDPTKAYAGACVILAYSVPLEDGKRISVDSLTKACDKALISYISDVKAATKSSQEKHHFGSLKSFLRRQRKKSPASTILKYAAMLLISAVLLGTVTLSVSAELRERFFAWVITTYEKYSSFGITAIDNDSVIMTDIAQIQISLGYVPDGFEVVDETLGGKRQSIHYCDQNGIRLSVMAALPEVSTDMNTEGIVVNSVFINGNEAKRWKNNGTEFIVWEQQGYMLSLLTELDQETALKIAENIQILQ